MPFTFNPAVTIYKWPAKLCPSQITVHLQGNTTRFESPFTRSIQTQELPGARFNVSASLPPLDDAGTRAFRAFVARLRGSAGRFYFPAEARSGPVPDGGQPEAQSVLPLTADSTRVTADSTYVTADATIYIASTVATVTAGGDSTTIVAAANQPTGAVVIEAGRHLSYDTPDGWRQLCIVVEDAVVDAGGIAHITVEPPMRVRPVDGTPLHLRGPSGVFMLADDSQGQILQTPGIQVRGHTSIEAIEAKPPRITV